MKNNCKNYKRDWLNWWTYFIAVELSVVQGFQPFINLQVACKLQLNTRPSRMQIAVKHTFKSPASCSRLWRHKSPMRATEKLQNCRCAAVGLSWPLALLCTQTVIASCWCNLNTAVSLIFLLKEEKQALMRVIR